MCFEGPFQLPMKTLDDAVGDRMVRRCLQPKMCRSLAQSLDSNLCPRSVVGTPNRAIHPKANVWATVSAVISGIGNASGQRVNRSIHVSK